MKRTPLDDLLTCEEVAAELKCSIGHVWDLIASKRLAALNITQRTQKPPKRKKNRPTYRVRRQALDEYRAAVELGYTPAPRRQGRGGKHARQVPDRVGAG